MERRVILLVVAGMLSAPVSLAGQSPAPPGASDPRPPEWSAGAPPGPAAVAGLSIPAALPPSLAPPLAAGGVPDAVLDDTSKPLPFLFAIFGGVAGLFVGKWALSRGCEENCSEQALYGGILGMLAGGALGYLVGGGELPEQPPPGRPWP